MTRKKQYKNRLPTVLPPAPRLPPAIESLPREPPPRPEPQPDLQPTLAARPEPQVAPGPAPAPEPEPAPAPEPEPEQEPAGAGSGPPPRSWTILVGLALLATLVALGALVAAYVGSPGGTDAEPRRPGAATTSESLDALPEESYVETRVRRDGDMVVRQWISSEVPLRHVALALPQVSGARLSAARVSVLADGVQAPGPRTITRGRATYYFKGSTDVRVTYRLTGAVLRGGSVTGRALALATTLDVGFRPRPARETRVVLAPEVLSLACAASSTQSPVPCGSLEGLDRWRVELSGDRVGDRVLAQVTLRGETPAAAGPG